jgi:hypothetical protein
VTIIAGLPLIFSGNLGCILVGYAFFIMDINEYKNGGIVLEKKSIATAIVFSLLALPVPYVGGVQQIQASNTPIKMVSKPTTTQDLHKLLPGWTLSGINNELYKNRKSVSFEKVETINTEKWKANQLRLVSWNETEESFEEAVKNFIQEHKEKKIPLKIKKHTSTVFEGASFDDLEYTYVYAIKTKTGYIAYQLDLSKVNQGWKYGFAYQEIPTKAMVATIDKVAPLLIQKFVSYQFVDTQKNEPTMKAMSLQKEWKLTDTRISGNAKTEYMPNGWSREFEKTIKTRTYHLSINKTIITKQKHAQLLNQFKSISTLTNSSASVKAYRTTDPISLIDDYPGIRSGDSRIVFVQKKESNVVEYYKIYFDVHIPEDDATYHPDKWSVIDKNEANQTFATVINSLIKANPQ